MKAAAPRDAAEEAWLRDVGRQLEQTVPPFDAEAVWRRVEAQLQATQTAAPEPHPAEDGLKPGAGVTHGLFERLRERFLPARGAGGAWAGGMAFVLGVLVAAPLAYWGGQLPGPAGDALPGSRLEPLGSDPGQAEASPTKFVLDVALAPGATVADLRAALDRTGAQIVSGPSALGLWQLGFAQGTPAEALLALRQESVVSSAALRTQP